MRNSSEKFVIDNIPFPIWIKDLDEKFIFFNKEFARIHNINMNEELNIEEDVCAKCLMFEVCKIKVKEVIKNNKMCMFDIESENRINNCYINPFFDENDNLLGVIGVIIDITPIKEKQIKLEERENILTTIIDTLPEYIFYKDKDSRYVGYNKKWSEHYKELGILNMVGKNDFELGVLSKEEAENFMEQDKEIMKTKQMKTSERRIIDENGRERIEETRKVPVINENGEVWGIVGLSSDVTERIELKEKLIKLSYTDSLTDVYNRAYFEEKKEEFNEEKYLPIGIIMGDVNGLKVINDTFGHLEGDRLLKSMAKILKNGVSKEDFIFRWGGDEFIILMPNCNESKCEKVISNIMSECKKSDFNLIDISISLGSSIKDCLDGDIYINLKEAEEKLYRQKFLQEKSVRSSIIFSLIQSLHEKNVETNEHTKRLVKYAIKIGEKLGFTTAQLDEVILVTKLHDIGKIGISEEILLKPEKLSEVEFREIKTHTEKGYRILNASGELSHIARGILTHHERYDGAGYPLGLKGEEIPIMARIVNIVDSYDAMTNYRGYNEVKTKEGAIEEIIRCKSTQFDPEIADVFIDILKNE